MNVTEFDNLCNTLVSVAGLTGHLLVAQEQHATNKLRDRRGIWLVAVLPTLEVDGGPDQETESNVTLLFVLESAFLGQSDQEELEQYERTQKAMWRIREYLSDQAATGCSPLANYQPGQTVINPEYQIFSDHNGWSMSVVF